MPLMQQRHFEYLADKVAPLLPWPTSIVTMADDLASTNPRFKKEKFIERATAAWEAAHPPQDLNDDIPY